MKKLKRKIALLLTLCMVLTGITPAYADVETVSEAAAFDTVIREETENVGIIEEASPAEAEYDLATPSDAKHIALEKPEKDSEENVAEKATPSNAKREGEILIREIMVDGIKITLIADAGVFPEDAELWTEKVEDEAAEEAIEEAVEKERDKNVNVASSYKFNIKMLLNGEEIQPDTSKGSVKVTFTLTEELSECLEANAYHLKEEADGELTAENLGAEVKTVEAAAAESAQDEDALPVEEVISDGIIESEGEVNAEVTEIEAEVTGFSYYVVEFTYDELQYVLPGDSSVKLSEILKTFSIEGTVSEAEVSNSDLFTVTKDEDGDDWTVTALQAFSSEEWMKVTIGEMLYEITVTDSDDAQPTVSYYDIVNGYPVEKSIPNSTVTEYIPVTSGITAFEAGKWYVVTENVTIDHRVETQGDVHLILTDGNTLTITGGIRVSHGNDLTITGQKNGNGNLIINGVAVSNAGIGANHSDNLGNVSIFGGTVNVTGGMYGCGIGGGRYGMAQTGTISIRGGKVTAVGGDVEYGDEMYGTSGIGSTYSDPRPTIYISGGNILATGKGRGSGIGSTGIDRPFFDHIPSVLKAGPSTAGLSTVDHTYYGANCNQYKCVSINYTEKAYTVRHLLQKAPGSSEYEQKETESLIGYIGNKTEARKKTYSGYSSAGVTQKDLTSSGTVTVDIKYDLVQSRITFDSNGHGTAPDPITGYYGQAVAAPDDPVEYGYVFEGWYTDKDCTEKYTFTTMPAEDITLYAKWGQAKLDVDYVDSDGITKTAQCYLVNSQEGLTLEAGTWYAVTEEVTIKKRIQNNAPENDPAHLIIADSAALKASDGISNPEGKGLCIYGQENGSGKLTADNISMYNAAIGGAAWIGSGTLTINGGIINAAGGERAAAIGGGFYGNNGSITINGGIINAKGGDMAAAIGGGYAGKGKSITINGGTVTAIADRDVPAIGGEGVADLTVGTDLEILAGTSESDRSYRTTDSYKKKRDRYAYVHAVPSYTVRHLKQNEDKTGYDEAATETLKGNTGTKTKAIPKTYEGYNPKSYEQQIIKTDGSTVVEIYYDSGLAEKVELSFDTMGGSSIDAQQVEVGQKAVRPDVPSKSNYVFKNWYADEACTTLFDFDFPITTDTTAYAGWEEETYIITWQMDDGTVIDTTEVKYCKLPSHSPVQKENYIFKGWDPELSPAKGDTTYTAKFEKDPSKWHTITWKMDNGETIDTSEVLDGKMPEHDPVEKEGYLFAGWNPFVVKATADAVYTAMFAEYPPDKLAVAFDTAGGSFIPPQFVVKGQTASKPADPTKEGYLFDGWFTDMSYGTLFDFGRAITKETVIYAKWTKAPVKIFEINWMLNDITLIDTTEVTEGEMPVHENPEREGYIFIGWQPALAPVTGNAKYTAYFEERGTDKVAVTFHTDGGTFINTQVIDRNTTPVKPEDPQKAGCVFDGWYREAGFVTPYNFNEVVNTDMILYAKWKVLPEEVYTVTWKLDDGTRINTTKVKAGDMPSHSSPSKTGYIFVGWEPALFPVTSDITYTARFEQRTPDKAAVTFNTSGGSFIETQVVMKGQKAVRPSNPVKTGYSFVNWYADAAFTVSYDFNTAVSADITLFAKWQKNAGKEYTITFTDWDGKLLVSLKVEEGGLPVYPKANPTRSGYIFNYWDSVITLATCDKTYKATYVKQSTGGGGGGGTVSTTQKAAPTFSPNWYSDAYGVWRIRNSAGQTVANAWLCDDVVKANGQNVWYLLTADGSMIANGLVQDNTGNFYSLETEHNGYFGMLRYQDGYYNCNGQEVYLTFNREHNGSFGAITNAEGLEKLKAIYGVTKYGIGNENAVYTAAF